MTLAKTTVLNFQAMHASSLRYVLTAYGQRQIAAGRAALLAARRALWERRLRIWRRMHTLVSSLDHIARLDSTPQNCFVELSRVGQSDHLTLKRPMGVVIYPQASIFDAIL